MLVYQRVPPPRYVQFCSGDCSKGPALEWLRKETHPDPFFRLSPWWYLHFVLLIVFELYPNIHQSSTIWKKSLWWILFGWAISLMFWFHQQEENLKLRSKYFVQHIRKKKKKKTNPHNHFDQQDAGHITPHITLSPQEDPKCWWCSWYPHCFPRVGGHLHHQRLPDCSSIAHG